MLSFPSGFGQARSCFESIAYPPFSGSLYAGANIVAERFLSILIPSPTNLIDNADPATIARTPCMTHEPAILPTTHAPTTKTLTASLLTPPALLNISIAFPLLTSSSLTKNVTSAASILIFLAGAAVVADVVSAFIFESVVAVVDADLLPSVAGEAEAKLRLETALESAADSAAEVVLVDGSPGKLLGEGLEGWVSFSSAMFVIVACVLVSWISGEVILLGYEGGRLEKDRIGCGDVEFKVEIKSRCSAETSD